MCGALGRSASRPGLVRDPDAERSLWPGSFQRRGYNRGGDPGVRRHYWTRLFGFSSIQLAKTVLGYQRHELRTVPHRHERSEKAFRHPSRE